MEWVPYIFSWSVPSFTLLILNTWILFIPHMKHIHLLPNPHLGFLSSSISEVSEWSTGTSIRTQYSSEWISSLWSKGQGINCTCLNKHTHTHTHTHAHTLTHTHSIKWKRQQKDQLNKLLLKKGRTRLPCGSVVKNPSANAGDTGFIPDLGGSHILQIK